MSQAIGTRATSPRASVPTLSQANLRTLDRSTGPKDVIETVAHSGSAKTPSLSSESAGGAAKPAAANQAKKSRKNKTNKSKTETTRPPAAKGPSILSSIAVAAGAVGITSLAGAGGYFLGMMAVSAIGGLGIGAAIGIGVGAGVATAIIAAGVIHFSIAKYRQNKARRQAAEQLWAQPKPPADKPAPSAAGHGTAATSADARDAAPQAAAPVAADAPASPKAPAQRDSVASPAAPAEGGAAGVNLVPVPPNLPRLVSSPAPAQPAPAPAASPVANAAPLPAQPSSDNQLFSDASPHLDTPRSPQSSPRSSVVGSEIFRIPAGQDPLSRFLNGA